MAISAHATAQVDFSDVSHFTGDKMVILGTASSDISEMMLREILRGLIRRQAAAGEEGEHIVEGGASVGAAEEAAQLLPFPFSAAIAGTWNNAELLVAYIDGGSDSVLPTWIAE